MRVLVDTSALLALSRRNDQNHKRAVLIAERHLSAGGSYVGTTLVLGELHSHLLYTRGISAARAAIGALLEDPIHQWLDVDADLLRDAIAGWLVRFADQGFSLIDAVSFEVMKREKIRQAFAFGRHFEIAGFEPLK